MVNMKQDIFAGTAGMMPDFIIKRMEARSMLKHLFRAVAHNNLGKKLTPSTIPNLIQPRFRPGSAASSTYAAKRNTGNDYYDRLRYFDG